MVLSFVAQNGLNLRPSVPRVCHGTTGNVAVFFWGSGGEAPLRRLRRILSEPIQRSGDQPSGDSHSLPSPGTCFCSLPDRPRSLTTPHRSRIISPMGGSPPIEFLILLVESFGQHIDAYKSGKYNETQLRREFLDPLFDAWRTKT